MRSLCPSLRSRIWIVVAIALCAGCDDPINSFITECEGPYPDQTSSVYVLPYEPGRTFVVGQGNCSTGSHAKGTLEQYAYDFLMPIGTPVVAARDGIVLLVEERFEDGTQNPSQLNYINITHPDGTIAAYVHLTKDGALVGLNETVVRGQVIAISGNTGVSAEPHLHFHVQGCSGCSSIPITFRNTRSHPNGLVQGESYTAEP